MSRFKLEPTIIIFERRKEESFAFNSRYPKSDKIDGIQLGHIRRLELSRLQKLEQKLLSTQPEIQYYLPPNLKLSSQSSISPEQDQHEKRITASTEAIYHNLLEAPIQPTFEIENNEVALSPERIEIVSEKKVQIKEEKPLKGILKDPSLLRYCQYTEKYITKEKKNCHYYLFQNTKPHCVHKSVCKYYHKYCYKGDNCQFLHIDQ